MNNELDKKEKSFIETLETQIPPSFIFKTLNQDKIVFEDNRGDLKYVYYLINQNGDYEITKIEDIIKILKFDRL